MPFNQDYRLFYEETHIKFISPILLKAFSDDKFFDVVNNNILNPFCFLLVNELKNKNPNKEIIIVCLNEIKSQKNESLITDNILLVESLETRGEKLELVKSTGEEEKRVKKILSDLKRKLPPEWTELISIIKTITFVNIVGKESQLSHFSGSDTYRWGAIHMYKNINPFNIAECFTHEASHYWLNLYELFCPDEFIINGWSDESFVSPWRKDKRPLMGIFHGLYVFSNVFYVLNYLENNSSHEDSERIQRIGAQVKRGIEIMESHKSKLSEEARDLFNQIILRFSESYEKYKDKSNKHYKIILKEEALKNK